MSTIDVHTGIGVMHPTKRNSTKISITGAMMRMRQHMDGTTSWDKLVVDVVDFANYIQLAEIWSHIHLVC